MKMTPTEASFLTGLKRVINSAKVQFAFTSVAGSWVAIHFATASMDQSQRAALWLGFLTQGAVVMREVINSFAEEDVARLQNQSPPPAPLPEDPASPPESLPAPVTAPKPAQKQPPIPRTKLTGV